MKVLGRGYYRSPALPPPTPGPDANVPLVADPVVAVDPVLHLLQAPLRRVPNQNVGIAQPTAVQQVDDGAVSYPAEDGGSCLPAPGAHAFVQNLPKDARPRLIYGGVSPTADQQGRHLEGSGPLWADQPIVIDIFPRSAAVRGKLGVTGSPPARRPARQRRPRDR